MCSHTAKPKVLIVGGGLAGLATAAYLARGGKEVSLVERAPRVGGRAVTLAVGDFLFNMGPHALYDGGPARTVLDELGVEVAGGNPLSSGLFAVNGGVCHRLPTGVFSLLTTSLFGWRDKVEAARFLASLPKIDAGRVDSVPLGTWFEGRLRRPLVRQFFAALVRLASYVNAPQEMSAGLALRQLRLALTGKVLYLNGGWQTLVDGLENAARQAGASIQCGARAVSIEHSGGAVTAVTLADGTRMKAEVVVVAASPKGASQLVEGSQMLRSHAAESLAVRAACLDVGLAQLPKPNHSFGLGIDSPLYLSVHSLSARLAPPGKALIHVAKYLEPDGAQGDGVADQNRAELERFLDLQQPGWRDVALESRFMPAMVVCHSLPTAAGRGLEGRPKVQVSGIRGLYVAGDWVGAEGILADATLASARQAAQEILKSAHRDDRRAA